MAPDRMEHVGYVRPQHLAGILDQDAGRPDQPIGICYLFAKETDVRATLTQGQQSELGVLGPSEGQWRLSILLRDQQGARGAKGPGRLGDQTQRISRWANGVLSWLDRKSHTEGETRRQSITKGEEVYQWTIFTILHGCINISFV